MEDKTKAIAYATLMPGAACVVGYGMYFADCSGVRDMLKKAKKPKWCPDSEAVLQTADMVTLVPVVYAAYRVYRLGGFDHEDTRMALTAYGGLCLGATLISIPAMMKATWTGFFWNTVIVNAMQMATTALFFSVDRKCGLLTLPSTMWGCVGVLLMHSICEMNP